MSGSIEKHIGQLTFLRGNNVLGAIVVRVIGSKICIDLSRSGSPDVGVLLSAKHARKLAVHLAAASQAVST